MSAARDFHLDHEDDQHDEHAELAARAVHSRGDCKAHAALQLTRSCGDPGAFTWWWVWLGSTSPDAALPLVAELPVGLVLPSAAVPRAVDVMTATDLRGPTSWVDVRRAVLRRLDPDDPGSCDLATLVACDPGTHSDVLVAALALLEAAGHPSRRALLRAAEAAVDRATRSARHATRPDTEAVLVAATLLCALSPAPDQAQRQLAERCALLVQRCAEEVPGARTPPPWHRQSHWVGAVLSCLRA